MAKRRYANALYRIEFTDTGDDIGDYRTYREAMAALKRYEREDEKDGTFTPGFYTIARFTSVKDGAYYKPIYDSLHGEFNRTPRKTVKKKTTAKKPAAKKKTVKRY